MAIDQITRRDVAARIAKIATESGAPTAVRARAALSAMYAWALGHGLCEVNPVVGTDRPRERAAPRAGAADAELAAIWRACGDDDFGRIVKLLLLTGQRRSEIGGMRWSEIDIERGDVDLPRRAHEEQRHIRCRCRAMALDIIAAVPRMVERDQLFGLRSGAALRTGPRQARTRCQPR